MKVWVVLVREVRDPMSFGGGYVLDVYKTEEEAEKAAIKFNLDEDGNEEAVVLVKYSYDR